MSSFQLHHNGYLTADLEKAAATLEQRFGYVRESDTIHDAVQTANVQFLRLPGGRSCLELVRPDGPDSKLARTLKKHGEGWHHVCYEVADIAAAGASLRNQGMLCVCEPVLAVAFPGRRIAWFMDASGLLVELVEAGADSSSSACA
ncbi:MAG: VOC family protein [Verrucomicrobiota bacterium]